MCPMTDMGVLQCYDRNAAKDDFVICCFFSNTISVLRTLHC